MTPEELADMKARRACHPDNPYVGLRVYPKDETPSPDLAEQVAELSAATKQLVEKTASVKQLEEGAEALLEKKAELEKREAELDEKHPKTFAEELASSLDESQSIGPTERLKETKEARERRERFEADLLAIIEESE